MTWLLGLQNVAQAHALKLGIGFGQPASAQISYSPVYYYSRPFSRGIGPIIELSLPRSFAIEASPLRKTVSYGRTDHIVMPSPGVLSETTTRNTKAIAWEVPLVVKKYAAFGSYFGAVGGIGINMRRTRGETHVYAGQSLPRTGGGPPFGPISRPLPERDEVPQELANKWSTGIVLAGGPTFAFGRLNVQPTLRYTRWSNAPFESADRSLQSSRNTLDVLLGMTVRILGNP